MYRLGAFLVLAILATEIVGSCQKSTKATIVADPLYIPWNMDSLMPATVSYVNGVSKLNVSGILVACKLSGNIPDTTGQINSYARNWEVALFRGSVPFNFIAGIETVAVNSVSLNKGADSGFEHFDGAPLWNENSLNHWYVSGSSDIPVIDTDVAGEMPAFTGILPVTVSHSSDFSLTFNSTNTANADSAFVVLYGGTGPVWSNVADANGGTAVIKASMFVNATDCPYCSLTGLSSDPFHYSGSLIMVVVYNHTIMTFGGKQFAFIKQKEYLGVTHNP